MTGIDVSAHPPRPSRRRWRLPASRGGVAWLIVVVIGGILLAAQFARQVYANWEIGQRAAAIEAQIAEVEQQNADLERELAYLRSDAYISAEARRLANLGTADENVLIIPPGARGAAEATPRAVGRPLLRSQRRGIGFSRRARRRTTVPDQ